MKKVVKEKTILSGAAGEPRHRYAVLSWALFMLAVVVALVSGFAALAAPVGASAKAIGARPNRVWENCVATARYERPSTNYSVRYESVGFIGQIHRHTATKLHIATGYAGGPMRIPKGSDRRVCTGDDKYWSDVFQGARCAEGYCQGESMV